MLSAVKRKIWRLQRVVRSRLGVASRMNSPDRLFQENVLIPAVLKGLNAGNVLYVGVSWYTYHYYKHLFQGIELTTLDTSGEQAVFGSRNHIIGDLSEPTLGTHAPFDAIFLLGILNYGIDDAGAFRAALVDIDRLLAKDACCYLTVEEDLAGGKPGSIRSDEMISVAESRRYCVMPISQWFSIIGGKARTRFYVMSKNPQKTAAAQSKFPLLDT